MRIIDDLLVLTTVASDSLCLLAHSAIILAQKQARTSDTDKIKRFLLNKGYSYDTVTKAIDNLEQMDDN